MKSHFLKVLDYEFWANSRIIEMLENLPAEQEGVQKAGAVFSHILAAQRIWYCRIKAEECPLKVWGNVPAEDRAAQLSENIDLLHELISSMEEADFDRIISYSNSFGLAYENPVREILTHFPMHSAYHRGQIVLAVRPLLDKVPLFDYIQYAREELAV